MGSKSGDRCETTCKLHGRVGFYLEDKADLSSYSPFILDTLKQLEQKKEDRRRLSCSPNEKGVRV